MSTWSGETNSGFAGDPAYDPPLPDLDTLIGTIDERSGYSSGRTASGDLADLSPNPDSAPLAGYDQCRELADGLRSARLSLRDVVSRVSDSIVQQRIEAVIGLLARPWISFVTSRRGSASRSSPLHRMTRSIEWS